MPFNWGNIWPGGKPFYTPTQTTNTQIGNPSTGTHLLHPDATKRQNEKTAAMRALIEQNPDQLGTIQNTGQVNKGSMFPPWMGALMGSTAGGIYGAGQLAKNKFNSMMGNYNLANKSGLDLSNYITLGGTKPVINQGQLLSDVNDQLPRNLTQDLGASTVQASNIPYDRIMNKDLMNMDRGNIDNRGFNIPSVFGAVKGGLEWLGNKFQMSPEKRAEVEALRVNPKDKWGYSSLPGTGLRGNIWQGPGGRKINVVDPVTGAMIVRDKNLQSGFGSKSIAEMLQKQEDRAKGRFEKYGDEWTDDEHKGLSTKLYNYYKQKGLIDQWRGQPETVTTGETTGGTTIGDITGGTAGGGDYQRAPINEPDPSFSAPSTTGHMGPGGVHYAYGGRAGYQDGELVDEDINIEGPGFDVNENLMASDPGAMDSLNEMSLNVFGKPLDMLTEEEYGILIDMANEQASAGQDQGLASLV